MIQKLTDFFKDEEGATAVEYGIMVAAIAAVIIGIVIAIGTQTENAFNYVEGEMQGLPGSSGS
jgi:pilus assembly protein Flp/PilA